MKNLLLIAFMIAGIHTGKLVAQGQPTVQQEKMKIFADWTGRWQGTGSMQTGPGEPRTSSVDETVELKLDGTILVVEGIGKGKDPKSNKEAVVHHAFGVLSYDAHNGEYNFRTHLSDGRSTDAWFKVTESNNFQWGFDIPNGKIRYNIQLDPESKTWRETGEYSQDGNNWMKFFDMSLKKVG